MATVTGYTAQRMKQIEDSTVVDGDVIGTDLILKTRDGSNINAGSVQGPIGPDGPPGPTSIIVCTSTSRPTGASLYTGLGIYETDTKRFWIYNGVAWSFNGAGGMWVCTSTTRPANPLIGLTIYETDTGQVYIYSGSVWVSVNNPSKRLAYVQQTATQGPTTGTQEALMAAMTTPSINIPSATRLVRVEAYVRNGQTGAGEACWFKIREGNSITGIQIQDYVGNCLTGGSQIGTCSSIYISRTYAPGAGPKQWCLTLAGTVGPAFASATATSPMWLQVMDLGG